MLREWWTPTSVLLGAVVLGLLAEWIARRQLARWSSRTATYLDDAITAALRGTLTFWFLLGGITAASRYAPISEAQQALFTRLCGVALLVSITIALSRFADRWLGSREVLSDDGAMARVVRPSLVRYVVRTLILAGGAVIVLDNLGLEITALLTALGVGSIAVALAMQPTLSNLFAGVHLSLARPIRVGDFIELDEGTQGFVEDIGWRATKIRQLANNLVIVPNAKLAEMVIKNYALPDPEQAVVVPVSVAYDADLSRVERITMETARIVQQETPGAVPEFEPFIRYNNFGDSAIEFSVILRARTFVDRYLMLHELHKRIRQRYAEEGIEIPFPQRVVHWVGNGDGPSTREGEGPNTGKNLSTGEGEGPNAGKNLSTGEDASARENATAGTSKPLSNASTETNSGRHPRVGVPR